MLLVYFIISRFCHFNFFVSTIFSSTVVFYCMCVVDRLTYKFVLWCEGYFLLLKKIEKAVLYDKY